MSGVLFTIHSMLAGMTKNEFLAINENEAKSLGSGIANVARHYDVGPLSPQLLDWTALAMCIGSIYGPRIVAMRLMASANRAPKQQQQPGQPPAPSTAPVQPDLAFGLGNEGLFGGLM